MTIDDGPAVSYNALPTGIPVYGSDEVEAGTLTKVLDNAREMIFDGIEVKRRDGVVVFVDAPEVARTAERGVTLNITAEAVDAYEAVKTSVPASKPSGGFLSRLFGR